MAEKYPSQSLSDQTTASREQSEPIEDQYGLVVDQTKPMGHQHGQQGVDHTGPDPVQVLVTDKDKALQYAQKTGAATVNFTDTQYNISGGQTIQNIYYQGQTQANTADMSTESATSATFDYRKCQAELREYYLEETGKVNLLPWMPEENKEMGSIFVDLKLVRKDETKTSQDLTTNEDLVTLKTSQGQRVNRVLVTGDAGSGKSTTAGNLAYKWAMNDTQSPLSEFALVFLIRMKDIEDSKSSLVDMIFDNILTEDSSVSKEGLSKYIKENAKDVLFIIDGMDEDSSGALKNKSSGITKLLHRRKLPTSCVILTSRPRNISDLGTYVRLYTQVKLEGFSIKSILKYIEKYFRDDKEKVDLLFRKLKAGPHILALASIPVLLLMICMLWEDQRTTPKTKTQLYQKTTRYLLRIYKARMGGNSALNEDSDNDEFDEELKDILNRLGEVALYSFSINSFRLTFTEKEFGRDVCDLGCQVGILRREQSRAGVDRKTSVRFSHATFQEFCAAFHLAYLLDTKQKKLEDFDGNLFELNKHGFIYERNVISFCSGIRPEVTTTFLQIQTKHTHPETNTPLFVDISIHLQHIFEGQLSYAQCSNLIPLCPSCSSRIVLTDYLIPSVCYVLELYKSSGKKTGFLSTIKSLEVKTGCSPWLPTLLKHTNNLHDYTVFLGASGTERDLDMMYEALSALPNISVLNLVNLDVHAPYFHRLNATNLLNLLTAKKVKLTGFSLLGLQFDEQAMVRYLSSTRTSILSLGLSGMLDARGQLSTINCVVEKLPCLKNVTSLGFVRYQIHSAIKHLRPIISQLEILTLNNCRLREQNWKELFSFLRRAQKLKSIDFSGNLLSVASVQALVESLKENPALETLILENTNFNDESSSILARFLKEKSTVTCLGVENNPGIGLEGKYAL